MRHVEVHAKTKGGAHAGGPLNEHPEQEAEGQQDEVALTFSENHGERGEGVGLGGDELNASFGQLNGEENRHTGTDDGARDNTHDVPFRDVIRSVTDVEAVLVIANDGPRHGNGRAEHGGPNQAEEDGVLSVEFEQVLGVEEHTEQHQQHDERRSRNGLNAGFTHDTNSNGTQHEGREDENGGEDQR